MAATNRVDPPPINIRVVDDNGFPTRQLTEYLYRLWARTADPAGNLLDTAANGAENAAEIAETSIQLVGNASQQLQQITEILVQLQILTNQHIATEEAHQSNGKVVGFNDTATTVKLGLVKRAADVTITVDTTAATSGTIIAAAPSAYNQAHYQTVVDLLNDRTAQLNTLINSYNNLTQELDTFRLALKEAGLM